MVFMCKKCEYISLLPLTNNDAERIENISKTGFASFTHRRFKPRFKLGLAKPVKPSLT